MTVQDVLDIYEAEENYVVQSIINKSYEDLGCTYKWLCKNTGGGAFRREIFISTTGTGTLVERTVIEYTEISEAKWE